jgi:hypothetical protein
MGKDLFKEIRRIATKLGESFGKIKESFEDCWNTTTDEDYG